MKQELSLLYEDLTPTTFVLAAPGLTLLPQQSYSPGLLAKLGTKKEHREQTVHSN